MSKFVVSARKYRPATFDELVGQDHIARTLKNALQTEQLAHAFLFCGPRGVGKTTSARILAKVINCENPQNDGVDPCNECSSCKSFADNASFNIIELDAASNNSVEHIRTLIEQVRFQPQQGKYKVFIIDEVHMLSSQAFNAFLKTLEEPPPYAIFILATTEKHKIIPTILSRCQIFDFKRIQPAEAVKQLELINEKEGRTADPEALHLIGVKADGAMRDALSIYDKIASAAGDHISYKDVVTNLNILDYDYYFKITDSLLNKDLSSVLLIMDEIIKQGFEPDQLVVGLSEHLRNLLVCKDPRTLNLLEGGESLKTRYANQASLAGKSFLLSGLDILNQCDISLPRASNKRLYVEIALGKLNHVSDLVEQEYFIEKKTEDATTISKKSQEHREVKETIQKTSTNSTFGDTTEQATPSESRPSTHPQKQETLSQPSQSTSSDEKKISPSPKEDEPDKGILNTPSFSNINNLMDKIKSQEAQKTEARKNLSLEAISEIWEDYSENNPSKSIRTALKLAMKSLDGTDLHIIVPNGITRDMVLQESDLVDRIRHELGVDELILHVRVDVSQFPGFEEVETKKVLTNKEKYEMMVDKNPLLADLRKKFELKVDKE